MEDEIKHFSQYFSTENQKFAAWDFVVGDQQFVPFLKMLCTEQFPQTKIQVQFSFFAISTKDKKKTLSGHFSYDGSIENISNNSIKYMGDKTLADFITEYKSDDIEYHFKGMLSVPMCFILIEGLKDRKVYDILRNKELFRPIVRCDFGYGYSEHAMRFQM